MSHRGRRVLIEARLVVGQTYGRELCAPSSPVVGVHHEEHELRARGDVSNPVKALCPPGRVQDEGRASRYDALRLDSTNAAM